MNDRLISKQTFKCTVLGLMDFKASVSQLLLW